MKIVKCMNFGKKRSKVTKCNNLNQLNQQKVSQNQNQKLLKKKPNRKLKRTNKKKILMIKTKLKIKIPQKNNRIKCIIIIKSQAKNLIMSHYMNDIKLKWKLEKRK